MRKWTAAAAVIMLMVGLTAMALAQGAPPAEDSGRPGAKMQIVSFTGQVQIKLEDGSIIGVVPGAPVPEIPEGAEIVVVSGEAVFESEGTVVTAAKGDSFTFDSGPDGVQIAATGATTSLQVTAGKAEAVVNSGNAIAVKGRGIGKGRLKVVAGQVTVTQEGQARSMVAGETADVDVPVTELAAAPAPPKAQAKPPVTAPPAEEPSADEPSAEEPAAEEPAFESEAEAPAPEAPTNPAQDVEITETEVSPSSP
ncbi:MAG: hypothetical protein ABII00_14240 [Elusimicrobiota bacterium]